MFQCIAWFSFYACCLIFISLSSFPSQFIYLFVISCVLYSSFQSFRFILNKSRQQQKCIFIATNIFPGYFYMSLFFLLILIMKVIKWSLVLNIIIIIFLKGPRVVQPHIKYLARIINLRGFFLVRTRISSPGLHGSSIVDLCVTTIQESYYFGFDILIIILDATFFYVHHMSLRTNFFCLLSQYGLQ